MILDRDGLPVHPCAAAIRRCAADDDTAGIGRLTRIDGVVARDRVDGDARPRLSDRERPAACGAGSPATSDIAGDRELPSVSPWAWALATSTDQVPPDAVVA